MIQDNLTKINDLINQENNIALGMLKSTIQAIEQSNVDILKKIIKDDEEKINTLEINTTRLCVMTLALFQPEAKFLRQVISALQINHGLERVADVAVNVAEKILPIVNQHKIKSQKDVLIMINLSIEMINDSIQAFINHNTELARTIFDRDDEVDDFRDKIISDVIVKMKQDTINIEEAIAVIHIAQDIERIADMTTTIAKNVVYMTLGEIIEH